MKLGWLGLGNMGVPMVRNVARVGYPITAFNRTVKSLGQDMPEHVTVVSDVHEAVADQDVVFVMVSDMAAVESLLFGFGAADSMERGTLVVNMSTIGVDESRQLADRLTGTGLRYLEAPVLGSVKPAMDATLVVLAGGQADDFAQVEPLLAALGRKSFYLGGIGQGAAMKLLVNAFLGIVMEMLAETVAYGERSGFARETVLDVLASSAVWAPVLSAKRQLVVTDDYPVQFALKHLLKDMQLALRQAEAVGAQLPIASAAASVMRDAVASGFGDLDMASLVAFRAAQTGGVDQA
ncbi:3-hydroxyisobutyrate dehydrogenase/glyoxylate/succinic semialdehyde reductase [Alicyclobacillus sacchari]|uniref:3-hydroxyisobutyrate dehydrogenase/glyoxylate/succinic semialdehyde reductase n=1 Tax=Alicyclobacillus sacchari TaxID=392010 RepID=A0A4R8LNQ7_9BACL|nr:NAD(P)-dependent oxidoreductase [Alicyclobacillus sacchari]TDY47876.1 3-hydroxyisobutyrate dehydrogenase/glyoxylate/succinic semialdehyde reductase [Alicyclobacillus sacchari]GMA55969.1 3-hydroxy acid dehydrogenase [Alicyclobacillus sacchari]